MKHARLLCLTVCCLLACACARQPVSLAPEQANATWQRYLAAAGHTPPTAGRAQLSLRFGKEGDSRRVTALMWGNRNGPLRLDIMAGVGVSVAKIAETDTTFLIYAPYDKKAYVHSGPQKPLLKVGLPIPLQLSAVFDLLNGEYAALFGERHAGATLNAKQEVVFSVQDGPLTGTLTLTENGQPARWRQEGGKGWEMTILYDESTPPLPRRVDLIHTDGHQAIVLVKNRETLTTPFTEAQMRLTLPEGTPVAPLSEYKNSNK